MNPILESTLELFDTMLGCSARRRDFRLITGHIPLHPVSAFIQLSGMAVGSICLTMPRRTALAAVHRLLDERCVDVNALVIDTVGEFTNIIAGNARTRFDSLQLEMGLPEVVVECNRLLDFPSEVKPMCLTFDSQIGPFSLMFSFIPNSSTEM